MPINNKLFINNLLNSKQLYDYSRNIVNFTKNKPLQLSNGKKNIKEKKHLNETEYTLHMKIINALDLIKTNRKSNKYLAICDDLERNQFTSRYDHNINAIINDIDYKYKNLITPYKNFNFNPSLPLLPPPPPPPRMNIKKKTIEINAEINNIKDLLDLCEKYPLKYDVDYNIDMRTIHKIKKPLTQLNNMIGMHKLKESIVDQILFFIQNLHINNLTKESYVDCFNRKL